MQCEGHSNRHLLVFLMFFAFFNKRFLLRSNLAGFLTNCVISALLAFSSRRR